MSTAVPESQAHNFISGAQSGIDPRTGLFSFPLVILSASENQTPFLTLTLSWSALQTGNPYGLGTGCTFGVTRYDKSANPGQLILSSGERYRVSRDLTGGSLAPRQCLLPIFSPQESEGREWSAAVPYSAYGRSHGNALSADTAPLVAGPDCGLYRAGPRSGVVDFSGNCPPDGCAG